MKRARLWATLTILVVIAGMFAPAAASAGTLTSASFTTIGTGYAATSAQNTRYDWNYTTATSSTLTRVSQTVPAGTNTYGARYLANPAITGNYATTPDSVSNSITGDIDIKALIAPSSWTGSPGSYQTILSKFVGGNRSYRFEINSFGQLELYTTADGNTDVSSGTGSVPGAVNSQPLWVRVTRVMNDGLGNHVDTYYTSPNGSSWTAFWSQAISGATSIYDSTVPVEIGSMFGGLYNFEAKYTLRPPPPA